MTILPQWVYSYLQYLQLPVQQPTYSYLHAIYQSHLRRIPFENITKIIQYPKVLQEQQWVPPVETFVDRLYQWKSGGNCFYQTYSLEQLLDQLGFQTSFRFFDPNHVVIQVDLDQSYLIDVGFNYPFLRPYRLNEPYQQTYLGDEVIYDYDPTIERWRLTRKMFGEITQKKVLYPEPLTWEEIIPFLEKSYDQKNRFMQNLYLNKIEEKRHITLKNKTFIERTPSGIEEIELDDRDIDHILKEEFQSPNLPWWQAVHILQSMLNVKW
ncbi:arylamine N-acetyltransferase [Tepidibacillus fermentans]|uniref:Arylamine N-acetyltransferase n=1 Tax=Tepidibacillus fermentans TaxID=1281767 RepID=A0A4R3KGK5_9BACI|nr:arylamine N-acetyltransferase [Tepidibacillus fermentans]TCS82564.1 arylamine N-acetyltransferase [Tepidibacillus fermentans]